tara:strand:- start:287 stop:466 length:180 start_codon:yes stop_codon:yes gene_type:complete
MDNIKALLLVACGVLGLIAAILAVYWMVLFFLVIGAAVASFLFIKSVFAERRRKKNLVQ